MLKRPFLHYILPALILSLFYLRAFINSSLLLPIASVVTFVALQDTVIPAACLLILEVLETVISYFREFAVFHKTCTTATYGIQKSLIKVL